MELDLHRLSIEEALRELELFLNRAYIQGQLRVRIVHGKGTGALRTAVQAALAEHPLVESHRYADYGEGDYGVTIVELVR